MQKSVEELSSSRVFGFAKAFLTVQKIRDRLPLAGTLQSHYRGGAAQDKVCQ